MKEPWPIVDPARWDNDERPTEETSYYIKPPPQFEKPPRMTLVEFNDLALAVSLTGFSTLIDYMFVERGVPKWLGYAKNSFREDAPCLPLGAMQEICKESIHLEHEIREKGTLII